VPGLGGLSAPGDSRLWERAVSWRAFCSSNWARSFNSRCRDRRLDWRQVHYSFNCKWTGPRVPCRHMAIGMDILFSNNSPGQNILLYDKYCLIFGHAYYLLWQKLTAFYFALQYTFCIIAYRASFRQVPWLRMKPRTFWDENKHATSLQLHHVYVHKFAKYLWIIENKSTQN